MDCILDCNHSFRGTVDVIQYVHDHVGGRVNLRIEVSAKRAVLQIVVLRRIFERFFRQVIRCGLRLEGRAEHDHDKADYNHQNRCDFFIICISYFKI